ncbi:hypothetical protein ACHAO1_010502 [Botrytis cinerea]
MSTPPPSEIDVNMKEVLIVPMGLHPEQGCPDEKTEHYLRYIRGIKGRKPPGDSIVSVIELYPKGYPQLAADIDSDEQLMLYRRSGFLQARLLLNKQHQMRALVSAQTHRSVL